MKRGTFKPRKVGLKRTPFKRTTKPKKARKPRLPTVASLRKKADDMLTPAIKRLFPSCMLCGEETQVAHHHVHKSKSSRLRYEFSNLINLCTRCHMRLHHNESYWAGVIIMKRGLPWFENLDRLKNEVVKCDRFFYTNAIEHINTW